MGDEFVSAFQYFPFLRASVRSTHQKTPACTVELGWDRLYDTFDDALAVANRVYEQA